MAADDHRRSGAFGGAGEALVFLAFVTAGAGYIVWAKFAGLPPVAVTLLPVGVMLLYAAAILFVGPMRVGEDQAGDNLYYMGFLFTLTSLAVSLWQFESDGAAEEIVRNFGIAVASTIAGIALRIFMNQLRRDPVAVERGVRVDLADAARRVRRELDATVLDLSHFRRGTQQAAAESWTAVRDEVSETTRGLVDDLRAATRPIRRAAERSGDRMDSLAATVDTLSLALDGLARRIDAMADPDRAIDGRSAAELEPLAALIEGLGDRLDAHADRLTAVADALAAMERRLSVLPPRAVVTEKGGQPEEAAPVRERIS